MLKPSGACQNLLNAIEQFFVYISCIRFHFPSILLGLAHCVSSNILQQFLTFLLASTTRLLGLGFPKGQSVHHEKEKLWLRTLKVKFSAGQRAGNKKQTQTLEDQGEGEENKTRGKCIYSGKTTSCLWVERKQTWHIGKCIKEKKEIPK